MENRMIIRLVITGFLIIGITFQFIGYATPGWFSYRYQRQNVTGYRSVSLWYTVLCPNESSDCSVETHREKFLKQPKWRAMQYAYQIASIVMAVLSFSSCIVGTLLTLFNIYCQREKMLCTYLAMLFLLLSVILAWRNVGSWSGEMEASKKMNPTFRFDFPYSIFLLAIGSILTLCICVQQFVSLFLFVHKRFSGSSSNEMRYSRMEDSLPPTYQSRTLFILFILTAVAAGFQLVGFVSPAWMITNHTHLKSYLGLWYSLACQEGEGCKVESYHAKFSDKYFFAIMYAIIVGNKVTATLSLTCSCVVVVLSLLIWLIKKVVEHLVLIVQLFILVSASLIWPVIGEMAAHSVAWKISISHPKNPVDISFPYSMFLMAVGSIIGLTVFAFHAFVLGKMLFHCNRQTETSQTSRVFNLKLFR